MTTEPRRALFPIRVAVAALLALPALLLAAPSAAAASSNTFSIKASEYVYKVSGSPKAGWTEITFANVGTEYHMMAVFPLKKGVTKKQLQAAADSGDQTAFQKLGGTGHVIGTPNLLSPGQSTTVVTKLPAGHFGMLCFVPAPDGKDHAMHGMIAVFDVSSQKSSFKPPKDGVVNVTVTDQSVVLPSSGLPAHGWAKVDNTSSVTRDLTFAHYASGATFDQANAYFNEFFSSGKVPSGQPPATIAAGVTSIPSGGSAYLELGLSKGNYAAVSSNSDAQNDPNPLHVDFTVK